MAVTASIIVPTRDRAGYLDVALRDFGLLVAALALARLAHAARTHAQPIAESDAR